MPQIFTFQTTPDDAGQRLDRVVTAHLDQLSRSRVKGLIEAGAVLVAGVVVESPKLALKAAEDITVTVPDAIPADPKGEDIPLDILFEDDAIIVVNKPAGLVVHPAAGHATGTLVNALIGHCGASLSGIGGVRRPGIVHRLDKDTSGVLVVAKSDAAHKALAAQFADHGRTGALERAYSALVWGAPRPPKGTIDAPLGRDPKNALRFAVRRDGKVAITHYRVDALLDGAGPPVSKVSCQLETGRTHQIRVHLAYRNHPLLGDPLYGSGFQSKANGLSDEAKAKLDALSRQALHARLLQIEHPDTGEILRFEAPEPSDFNDLVAALDAG